MSDAFDDYGIKRSCWRVPLEKATAASDCQIFSGDWWRAERTTFLRRGTPNCSAFCIFPFHKTIDHHKKEIPPVQVQNSGRRGDEFGKNSEWDTLRMENDLPQRNNRRAARGWRRELPDRQRSAGYADKGNETAGIEVSRDGIVDRREDAERNFVRERRRCGCARFEVQRGAGLSIAVPPSAWIATC